jgi:hypothetical protein
MRFHGAILACLSAASLTPCLADPPASTAAAASQPATPAAQATSTSQPATPATQATSASHAAAPAAEAASPAADTEKVNAEEKQLAANGYKPEMHNGTKLWCRRVQDVGSRLGSHQKECGTADELTLRQQEAQRQFQQQMPATYGLSPSPGAK